MAYDMSGDYGQFALPGHRYIIDVQPGEEVEWWKKGRKEELQQIEQRLRPEVRRRSALSAEALPFVPAAAAATPAMVDGYPLPPDSDDGT